MKNTFSWLSNKINVTEVNYGFGLCCISEIKKGERVIVFGGYVIDSNQFILLPEKLQNIAFQLDDSLYFGHVNENELEQTEYLNHSCEPNCGFNGEITVVAMRDIIVGEQITIDYAMCISSDIVVEMDCLCASETCRKIVSPNDWKNIELQKKYKGYFVKYIEDKLDHSFNSPVLINSNYV